MMSTLPAPTRLRRKAGSLCVRGSRAISLWTRAGPEQMTKVVSSWNSWRRWEKLRTSRPSRAYIRSAPFRKVEL